MERDRLLTFQRTDLASLLASNGNSAVQGLSGQFIVLLFICQCF